MVFSYGLSLLQDSATCNHHPKQDSLGFSSFVAYMIGEGPIVSLISGEEEGDGGDYVGDRVLASLPPRAPSPEEIEGSALKIGDIKAAQEMASAVRKQVLSEMNVAILAQANQTPGNARSLLQ